MQSFMHLEQLQSQISVGSIARSFLQSGLQQLHLFINTKATGPFAVHFKLLFQKQ